MVVIKNTDNTFLAKNLLSVKKTEGGRYIPPPYPMKRNFDIREHNNLIDEINAIVNNNDVAEVKAEYKGGEISYKVVKISRKVVASAN